jgi:hypothetical protein
METEIMVGLVIAVIGLIGVVIKEYFTMRRFKEGLKNASEALELKKRELESKNQLKQQDLELERRKQIAKEKWKNFEEGMDFLELLFSFDED